MHIYLTIVIPDEVKERLNDEYALLLNIRTTEILCMWPRCWLLIGFRTQDVFIIQACKQYLSRHQCFISTLMFELSLSPYYFNNGPVVSAHASAFYLNSGLRSVFKNEHHQSLNWLLDTHYRSFQNTCREFLIVSQHDFKFDNPLLDFAAAHTVLPATMA